MGHSVILILKEGVSVDYEATVATAAAAHECRCKLVAVISPLLAGDGMGGDLSDTIPAANENSKNGYLCHQKSSRLHLLIVIRLCYRCPNEYPVRLCKYNTLCLILSLTNVFYTQ